MSSQMSNVTYALIDTFSYFGVPKMDIGFFLLSFVLWTLLYTILNHMPLLFKPANV